MKKFGRDFANGEIFPKEERVKVEVLVREKMKAQVSWKKGGEVKGESSCK